MKSTAAGGCLGAESETEGGIFAAWEFSTEISLEGPSFEIMRAVLASLAPLTSSAVRFVDVLSIFSSNRSQSSYISLIFLKNTNQRSLNEFEPTLVSPPGSSPTSYTPVLTDPASSLKNPIIVLLRRLDPPSSAQSIAHSIRL